MHADSAAALARLDTAGTVPVAPQPVERCRICGSALLTVERHNAPGDESSTISLLCSSCCVTGGPFEALTTSDTKIKRYKPPALHPHPTVPAPASSVWVAVAQRGPGARIHRMTSAILMAMVRVRDWCASSDSVGRADVNQLSILAEHLMRPWLDHPVPGRHSATPQQAVTTRRCPGMLASCWKRSPAPTGASPGALCRPSIWSSPLPGLATA